jgi:hypothetical protein
MTAEVVNRVNMNQTLKGVHGCEGMGIAQLGMLGPTTGTRQRGADGCRITGQR